ncbi:tyrosine-type recombinase/integrase [Caloranaerobacter ferrireducens]|uniref:tyrosine-type recombinase/integrase n=1 Tax=Caloranaerobacter ferrireducens TaxID=1323370 RepID=UPI00084D7F68|nr:tyrosine-type recombinase/integrase [Caloranaerobacter ferrireducens]
MKKRDLYMDKYYLDEFKKYMQNLDKTELTINTYINNIISFIEWFNDSNSDPFDPKIVTTIDIRDFKSYLINIKNAKANTVNLKIMSLKNYFSFLYSYNYIKEDISKNIKKVKIQNIPEPKWINEKTFRKLRREIYRSGYKHHIVMIELFRHALRISEIINLKIDNIILREKGSCLLIYGKHSKYRKVPINSDCKKAIQDYLKIREKIKTNYNNLLLSERKKPYTRSAIWKIINKYSKRLGIHISPHQLRHYAIKKMVDEGVPLTVVADLVGHSGTQLISQVYAVPSDEDKEKAVEKL